MTVMGKQIEAELREARNAADAAVDEAMQFVDAVCQRAIGCNIVPAPGVIIVPGEPVDPTKAVLQVSIPLKLMMDMSVAANAWRRARGTVQ